MFDSVKAATVNKGFMHKLKRRLFAKPVCSVTADGYYVIGWIWKSGLCEIVESGRAAPGQIINLPSGCNLILDK